MELILMTGLFIPLVSFIFLICFSEKLPRRAVEYVGCSSILLSCICFTYLLCMNEGAAQVEQISLYNWIPINGMQVNFSLDLDHLSELMALIITGIGFLIHIYSVGYMDHDADAARYFSIMNYFIFSMLLLVLASDLLVLFIGWEGVGLASYLLIGYWYQRPAAAHAAKKAFVVNRIGDFGLLLGILLTFQLFGTSNISDICRKATADFPVGTPIITVLTLLYFFGATGKSAQLPLHVWLPDAMEGPTPVSALIHAATMVTAGVYLVVRLHPLFALAPITLEIIGYIGAATALFAALCATSQNDLKKVLAYSTISQLGLMFLACGVEAYYAAMFHLTTHAFVKALLFLAAGNVIHMMKGTTSMEEMGGLSKQLPKTNILFLIGVLSMSGIPPLAIFFSKDLILEEEFLAGYKLLYGITLFISVLTAFYLTRAYLMTFKGQSKSLLESIKEAPRLMLLPVAVLAFLSIVGGLLGFAIDSTPLLQRFLSEDSISFAESAAADGFHITAETWASVAAAVFGITSAALLYKAGKTKALELFARSFYLDQLYTALIIYPLKLISKAILVIFEPFLLNASIELPTHTSNAAAGLMQRVQSGQIRSYISWIVLGSTFFILYFLFEGFSWIS